MIHKIEERIQIINSFMVPVSHEYRLEAAV